MVAWGESGHGTEVKALMELGDGHEKKKPTKAQNKKEFYKYIGQKRQRRKGEMNSWENVGQ